ncbi:hypothetical protein BC939DRAFT_268021 [Gamsiella multidivaricata]|uniref:uncharacterized protein n=1 Tax=Gamsiella multidivaricata TaxID=101098 RepID=UPI00221F1B68|nr:uncharacterized protein BC939DRAFT_268021 [Gamsiella multidivaricata]KAI7819225.1 hypothetical protein BC939DRAFT_268021 [Gamsiella multidivaricata]
MAWHVILDDESDEEFLMQQFNWFEEDQDQLGSSSQMNSTPRSSGKQKQKHIQTPKQQPEPQQQTSQNEQIAAVELITKIIAPLSISCLDTAMTQSEDFMQAMEAEGDIKVHADEIEELSRPLSALSSTSRGSIHKIKKAKVVEVTSSSTTIHVSQDGTLMESQAEMTTTLVSASNDSSQSTAASAMGADLQSTTAEAAAPMKPKKKAHRSKRGGIKQRERQTNRQMAVGHDDDGLMFLEEPSDDDEDEDMLAMQDYLQVLHSNPLCVHLCYVFFDSHAAPFI